MKHIIHRDIKLDNILLTQDRAVKLIDFGFSVKANSQNKLRLFCGTPCYMAPEISSRKDYTGAPIDVWALGVLMF